MGVQPFEVGIRQETLDDTGAPIFPKDLVPAPRGFAERYFALERWTEMPRGGHSAAMEEPELLVEDIRAFFHRFR